MVTYHASKIRISYCVHWKMLSGTYNVKYTVYSCSMQVFSMYSSIKVQVQQGPQTLACIQSRVSLCLIRTDEKQRRGGSSILIIWLLEKMSLWSPESTNRQTTASFLFVPFLFFFHQKGLQTQWWLLTGVWTVWFISMLAQAQKMVSIESTINQPNQTYTHCTCTPEITLKYFPETLELH